VTSGQQRQCDDAGDDARHGEILERVHRDGFERVDLFGHAHRGELGANPGTHSSRHEERRDERARLTDEGERQSGRNHRLGSEALEGGARVHREHDADREPRGREERHRPPADVANLTSDFTKLVRRAHRFTQRARTEQRDVTDGAQPAEQERADRSQHRLHRGALICNNTCVFIASIASADSTRTSVHLGYCLP
jgi:hypothetical protein